MLHCIATADQNNLQVIVTYFELGIKNCPSTSPALECKAGQRSYTSLPSHKFPLFFLDARGALGISTPQLTRISQNFSPFIQRSCFGFFPLLGCCTKLSLLSKQYFNNNNKNTQDRKI